jgi:hypothetical protein
MDKASLLKKLETILDEAKRTSMWGTIEITLQHGEAVVIHETRSTKLRKEGNNPNERFETR